MTVVPERWSARWEGHFERASGLCSEPPRTRRHVGVCLTLLLAISKCPRAASTAGGVETAYWEAITVDDSTNRSPDKAEAYDQFVKPGDAVETPDGGLWVVNDVAGDDLAVVSAHRDALGTVYADVYDAVATRLPIKFTTKVVDARAVHRE